MDNNNAYLILCILLSLLGGVLYSYALYKKYIKSKTNRLWNNFLFILRTISVSLVILLLLNPQISRNIISKVKPVIYVAYDNSKSIKNLTDSTALTNNIEVFDSKLNSLSKKFQIQRFQFDSDVKPYKKLSFTGNGTNISRLLSKISSQDSKNVAGVVLVSDGNYNVGRNPIYSNNLPFHFYPVIVGDTTPKTNLYISNVQYNQTGFLKEKQPFTIEIHSLNNTKDTVINLKLFNDIKLLSSVNKKIKAGKRRATISISYLPKTIGWKNIKFQINNNVDTKYNCNLFIKKNKQKILILYSDVSPDIGLIHRAINQDVRFKVKIIKASKFKGKLNKYSSIIFHNIPSGKFSEDRWFVKAIKNKIPYWLIVGYKTNISELNSLVKWLRIKQIKREFDDVKCAVNKGFSSFKLNQDLKTIINTLPPIHIPSGHISLSSGSQILFTQSIMGIPTSRPAWVFIDHPYRASVTFGEGFWQWQSYTYLSLNSIKPLYSLILQTLRFLSIQEPKKRLFLLHKSIYKSSEDIKIKAKWINSNLIADNSKPLSLAVTDSINRTLFFNMIPENDYYKANIGFLDSGLYKTSITRKLNDTVFKDSGQFTVSNTNIENNSKQANVFLMRQLSDNGQVYNFSSISKLIKNISNNNSIKIVRKSNSIVTYLINNYLLLFLIIGLLFIEWIVRKIMGYL